MNKIIMVMAVLVLVLITGCTTTQETKADETLTGNIIDGVRVIELEAYRYDWSEPIITVKTGETVRIVGTSRDVTHGIAIPELRFNLQLIPGKTTTAEFTVSLPEGEYLYGCSVMCGPKHHSHTGKLIVVE